jgi:PAS domain S-box-containing protein
MEIRTTRSDRQELREYVVLGIAVMTILFANLIMYISGNELVVILTNLFYLFIVLISFFSPRRGILISTLTSFCFLGLMYLVSLQITIQSVPTLMQFFVFISTGTIVSHLADRIQKEEFKYQTILTEAEMGILLIDETAQTAELNEKGAKLIGYPEKTTLDYSTIAAIWEDLSICGDLGRRIIDEGSIAHHHTRFRRLDGSEGWLILNGHRLSDGALLITFADISRQMEEQDQIRRMHEEEHLLLDIVTHDLNNMNMAALGYAELVSMDQKEESKAGDHLVRTIQKGIEIIRNVNTLRRVHEEHQPRLRPIFLENIIKQEITRLGEPGVKFEGTHAVVCADDLIAEVFTNLIGNSLKFGGDGVQVTIRVVEEEDRVRVSIIDNGPGIPLSQRPTLFYRYSRGLGVKSGRGLGLYITRILIERYDGTISVTDRVEGDPASGTTISFTLKRYLRDSPVPGSKTDDFGVE